MKLKDRLIKMNACSEAVEWVGDRDLRTAWRECERGDWMLWYAARVKMDQTKIILAACECVRRVLKYVPPGEDRPRLAVAAAELAAKKPTKKNKAAAGAAARAAAGAAARAAGAAAWAAGAAARAAAGAAARAANAAARAAVRAAVGAAWAAAEAAGAEESTAQADIIRKYFPRPR